MCDFYRYSLKSPSYKKMGCRVGQTPALSDLYEIEADGEPCTHDVPMPPYIFNVTDIAEKDRRLTVEVTNLREDGTIEGTAPYGEFTVLRVGFHVTWAHKK